MKPSEEARELGRCLRNALNAFHTKIDWVQLHEDEVVWRKRLAHDFLTLMISDAQRMKQAWLEEERGDQ